jgi:hypothetical protein
MRFPPILAILRSLWRPAVLIGMMPAAASAQLPQPKLDWISPPGGQRGKQVEVTVGGADLDEGREFIFSHPQFKARPKRTPADEFYPDGQPILNQFIVAIGADVPPGFYEAQLLGRHGVSTVRVFHVTDSTELAESGTNHSLEQAQAVALGQLVNSRTDAEQEDIYAIELAAGAHLTCETWARRIDSQAEIQIEICRADGRPLKAKRRSVRRDPVLNFTAPATGKYLLRVQDATFRGGESYFYRLRVDRRPAMYSTLPPVVLPAGQLTFLNAHIAALARSAAGSSSDDADTIQVLIPEKDAANAFLFPIAAEPRELDAEKLSLTPRSSRHKHPSDERLGVPGECVRHFTPARDNGWIELKSDMTGEVVIEVFSQRLGLSTDPLLTVLQVVKSEKGDETLKQIAEADQGEERPAIAGYNATTDDPYMRVKLEKDAIYRMLVRDQNSSSRGTPGDPYRLVVRRPQPDFRLLVSPLSPWSADPAIPLRSPLTIRAGDALPIAVVALRQDGFAGDIVVNAVDLPPGLHCDPVTIGAGASTSQLVLTTDDQNTQWAGDIRVVGESQVGETRLRKEATPTSLVWDTTTAKYDRARLNRQLEVAMIKEPAPVSVRFADSNWEVTAGGTTKVKLAVSARTELKEPLTLAPVGLPDGVTARFTMADDRKSGELELTVGEKTAPGKYDFSVSGKPLVLYRNNPEAAARAGEDQARIAKLVEGFKASRQQLVAAAGAAADAKSPEIKQLDERLARGEAALKEATERATKLAAAAKPSERRTYVVSNMGTLRVTEKPKQ